MKLVANGTYVLLVNSKHIVSLDRTSTRLDLHSLPKPTVLLIFQKASLVQKNTSCTLPLRECCRIANLQMAVQMCFLRNFVSKFGLFDP